MGYRERRQLKAQQQQQALGQQVNSEQRIRLMAPRTMNWRDDKRSLGEDQAFLIDNALPDRDGLEIQRPKVRIGYVASASANVAGLHMVSYQGTTSATDRLWCIGGNRINDVGTVVDASATTTATYASITNWLSGASTNQGSYTQRDQTLIYVGAGNGGGMESGLKYQGGSALEWSAWSASVSGAPFAMWQCDGIFQFKSRIYTWDRDYAGFAYSSVDAIQGTFEYFNLAYVMGGEPLLEMSSLSRDGGNGPDDYAVFIGKAGTVLLYQGSNPGDASDWSLVGKYKIGKPFAYEGAVPYGDQLFVLCEDDVYVLPDDLGGKKQASLASYYRVMRSNYNFPQYRNGLYFQKKDVLIWADATTLSVKDNFAFTLTKMNTPSGGASGHDYASADADQTTVWRWSAWDKQARPGKMAIYKDRLFQTAYTNALGPNPVHEILSDLSFRGVTGPYYSTIITKPIPLPARTNISLVNPVFESRNVYTTAGVASARANHNYRVAVTYDREHKQVSQSTASANAWISVSASGTGTTKGLWTPGFGTGDVAQIQIEVLGTSSSAELILKYIDITLSNTGGI